jgi:hypothetical protein
MAWVTWSLPQVTLQQGVAGFGLVSVAYVIGSHELLTRTRLPVSARASRLQLRRQPGRPLGLRWWTRRAAEESVGLGLPGGVAQLEERRLCKP